MPSERPKDDLTTLQCEQHIGVLWPHDDCPGPGMPLARDLGHAPWFDDEGKLIGDDPLGVVRERLLAHYSGGADGLRRYRLGIHYDETGLEAAERSPLPEHLCSGDVMAAYRCLRDILAAAFPDDEGRLKGDEGGQR